MVALQLRLQSRAIISGKNKVGISAVRLYDGVMKKSRYARPNIWVFMTLDDIIRFPRNIRMNIRNSLEALYALTNLNASNYCADYDLTIFDALLLKL